MERALNLPLIELALGRQASLPSARELRRLLADVELGLFVRQAEMEDELLTAAWYLHAVASADEALELYPRDRREAAFRVSSHILDLYLQTHELSTQDEYRLTFAAQVGYYRGGLQPNAQALWRRAADHDVSFGTSAELIGLRAGISLLSFSRRELFSILRSLRDGGLGLARQLGIEELRNTVFGPAFGVAAGCYELAKHLTFGDLGPLEMARWWFSSSLAEGRRISDTDSEWVAAHLLDVADNISDTTVWSVLPPDVPTGAARAMTVSDPPVLTLWPPQLSLLSPGDGPHPLSPSTRRLLLSFPTSAGKTLIAQFLVLSHLMARGDGVCFVAPTHSLAREVRRDLLRRLDAIEYRVTAEFADWSTVETAAGEPDVVVMTPERLSFLLRNDLEGTLERFGLFVIDEAHLLGDRARGWNLESALSILHASTLGSHHRIALLSSAIGNRVEVAQWLDPEGQGVFFHDDWRGPRRLHVVYSTRIDWDSRRTRSLQSGRGLMRAIYDKEGVFWLRTPDGAIRSASFTDPVGEAVRKIDANSIERRGLTNESTSFYRCLVPAILHVAQAGPVLVIESTRPAASRLAEALADEIDAPHPPTAGIAEMAALRLGANHPLASMLRKGVAFHHAALPADVQDTIEDAIRAGDLRILVATTTLTEGVNLPVHSVVIASQGIPWDDPYIVGSKLLNAMGRAGRASKETEGWIILAHQGDVDSEIFDRFSLDDEELAVVSRLAADDVLELLAQHEQSIRDAEDRVFEITEAGVADFISFVWVVADALDRARDQVTEEELNRWLESTLGWAQLEQSDQRRWSRVASAAVHQYLAEDPERRHRWATAGIYLGSARTLEHLADDLTAAVLTSTASDLSRPLAALDLLISSGALDALLQLPEGEVVRAKLPRPHRSAGRDLALDIDLTALMREWVLGSDVSDLADRYLAEIPDIAYRHEQLADLITAAFENYFPWMLGILIPWVNRRVTAEDPLGVEVCTDLSAHVQWGVDHPVAVELMRHGIRSRRAANAVATAAADHDIVIGDLRDWLSSMTAHELVERFNASFTELDDLLSYARLRSGRAVATLISGDTWAFPTRLAGTAQGEARLEYHRDPDPRIDVTVAGDAVASVPTSYYSDVVAVLETGLPYEALVRVLAEHEPGWGEVTLRFLTLQEL